MEKNQINEISDFLQLIFEGEEELFFNLYKYIGEKVPENVEIDDTEFRRVFQQIEKQIKSEDVEYFHSIIPKEYGIFSRDDIWKLDIINKNPKNTELIAYLRDDDKKIELMKKFDLKDEFVVSSIIETIKDDKKKIELMSGLKNEICRGKVIKNIQDDNLKAKQLKQIQEEWIKIEIIETIKEDYIKIKLMEEMQMHDSWTRVNIVKTIQDDNIKLDFIDKCYNIEEKETLIETLKDNATKEKLMNELEKEKLLQEQDVELKKINFIQSKAKRIEHISKLKEFQIKYYRQNYADQDFIMENIDLFLKLEGFENSIKDKLMIMYEKNQGIVKSDFEIIDEKFIDALGIEKINQISCYPKIVRKILRLKENQLTMLGKCIDSYMIDNGSSEWTPLVNKILENVNGYGELIENISKEERTDYKKIIPILLKENEFRITSSEEIEKFNEIKKKKTDELIASDEIKDKQTAIFQKIFGQSMEEVKNTLEKFGTDIELIENEDLKCYIKSIREILDLDCKPILDKIYNEVESIENYNIIEIERMLKNEYCKLFNKGLKKIEEMEKIEGMENMYSAGTDFKMLIMSVAAYCYNQPENYFKDWNRPSIDSQHFCCSYIRNDMLGHASIPHICYGFSHMSEDSLMLSAPYDIGSMSNAFVSIGFGEKYYSPNNQINNTGDYNEMDYRRIQNGNKKQPDYIVVFQRDKRIDNLEKAQKASNEFGGLPIVVVDIDECLENESKKVDMLKKQYEAERSPSKSKELWQKVKNNRITDKEFRRDIDLENLKTEFVIEEDMLLQVSCDEFQEIYNEITPEERREGIKKLKKLYKQVRKTMEEKDYEER